MLDYTDDIGGIMIGGDYWNWQLYYEGRPQSQRYPADGEKEAIEAGKVEYEKIKVECGKVFDDIYRFDKWEIRIWSPT